MLFIVHLMFIYYARVQLLLLVQYMSQNVFLFVFP